MATEIRMPQLGESIAEATLVRWFKSAGEFIERDEPLFEVSTDKVDTEVPSTTSGYLSRILVEEGETVAVNTVVCVLSQTPEEPQGKGGQDETKSHGQSDVAVGAVPASAATAAATTSPGSSLTSSATIESFPKTPESELKERLRAKSSPLVRRLAAEHGIDLSTLRGTGIHGRVTKKDLLAHLARTDTKSSTGDSPTSGDRVEPLSPMRRQIAEHMVLSRRTSAHVTTVFEVDMSRVRAARDSLRPLMQERWGTKLNDLAIILKIVAEGLQAFPILNASLEEGQIRYHGNVNIGVAVAVEHGLLVPVVRDVDRQALAEVSRTVEDLAGRARTKKLKPDEVHGGTFTVTNPGAFGAIIGTPIIHQPQVGILCVGKIEKRPVVLPESDAIAVRTMAYLSLSYDHRLIDGVTADQFLATLKDRMETTTPADWA